MLTADLPPIHLGQSNPSERPCPAFFYVEAIVVICDEQPFVVVDIWIGRGLYAAACAIRTDDDHLADRRLGLRVEAENLDERDSLGCPMQFDDRVLDLGSRRFGGLSRRMESLFPAM